MFTRGSQVLLSSFEDMHSSTGTIMAFGLLPILSLIICIGPACCLEIGDLLPPLQSPNPITECGRRRHLAPRASHDGPPTAVAVRRRRSGDGRAPGRTGDPACDADRRPRLLLRNEQEFVGGNADVFRGLERKTDLRTLVWSNNNDAVLGGANLASAFVFRRRRRISVASAAASVLTMLALVWALSVSVVVVVAPAGLAPYASSFRLEK